MLMAILLALTCLLIPLALLWVSVRCSRPVKAPRSPGWALVSGLALCLYGLWLGFKACDLAWTGVLLGSPAGHGPVQGHAFAEYLQEGAVGWAWAAVGLGALLRAVRRAFRAGVHRERAGSQSP